MGDFFWRLNADLAASATSLATKREAASTGTLSAATATKR